MLSRIGSPSRARFCPRCEGLQPSSISGVHFGEPDISRVQVGQLEDACEDVSGLKWVLELAIVSVKPALQVNVGSSSCSREAVRERRVLL